MAKGSAPAIDMGLKRLVPMPQDQSFSSGCPAPREGAEGPAAHPDQLRGQTLPGRGPRDHTHHALGREPELRVVTDLLQTLFSLLPPDLLLLEGGKPEGRLLQEALEQAASGAGVPQSRAFRLWAVCPALLASSRLQHGQHTLSPGLAVERTRSPSSMALKASGAREARSVLPLTTVRFLSQQ